MSFDFYFFIFWLSNVLSMYTGSLFKSRLVTNAIKEQNFEVVSINWTQDLKVIPIVGEPKCPTRKLRELIDISLKPFLKHVKTYIRDSIDFLNKCDRNANRNAVITTFDVVCLCTQTWLEAIRYFLLKYKEDIHPRFNTSFTLKSIDFILKNNTCVFHNEYFLQLQGTAMGTVFGPTYANLSMGYHEIKLYDLTDIAILRGKLKKISTWLWNTLKH